MARKLLLVWWTLDILYLVSGVLALVVCLMFHAQDGTPGTLDKFTLRRLVVSDADLNSGIILGATTLASFALSVVGFAASRESQGWSRMRPLKAFNISIIIVTIITVCVGIAIWFFTLEPRANFMAVWTKQNLATQQFLQDTLQCCGYFNATRAGLFSATGGFCAAVAAGTNTTQVQGCIAPIGNYEDYTLNNIFSTVFGFSAIQVALFLATCCLINVSAEKQRFRLIDEKRGRKGGYGGFV